MRHGLATIGESQRRDGITATHHRRASTGCHSPRYFDGPLAKGRHFEDTHRTVPDHGVRAVQHLAKTSDSRHANIQTLPTGRNALICNNPRRGVGLDVLGNHVSTWQETLDPALGGVGENITCHGETIRLDQRIAYRIALYLQQGISHATTDEQGGDFLEKVHNEWDF